MSKKINPELKIGDRIVCIDMDGEPRYTGNKGTVRRISKQPTGLQYDVKWDDGSTLFLLSDTDKWMYEEDWKVSKKKINESSDVNQLSDDAKILKYFKMLPIKKYLDKIRESGVANMFGASPYLYIGEDILRKEHYNEDSDEFEDAASMADEVKTIMIRGAMGILEKEGKEITTDSVGRMVKRIAPKVLNFWMRHY
jgi:hypothetical protein